jgi:hypothetical protein
MKEWSTSASVQTDAEGRSRFRGFHGQYTATIQTPGREPITQTFTLQPGDEPQPITLTAARPSM